MPRVPCAQCRHYLPTGEIRVRRRPARTLLLGHRSYGLIAPIPCWLFLVSSALALPSCRRELQSLRRLASFAPMLPPGSCPATLSLRIFPRMLGPYTTAGLAHGSAPTCFLPPCHRPSPREVWVGFPLLSANTTSRGGCFRGCRPFFMFRPPSLLVSQVVPTAAQRAAGQPRLLHPGRTCFVASARTGYASRPNTGN